MISTSWVQQKIKLLGLRPSRGNGQNFLISDEPIKTIIHAGGVRKGDVVLEIGPGLGALTEELLKIGAHVTAIEFDPKLATFLQTTISTNKPLTVVQGDALHIATREFLLELAAAQPYKLIANIPYHITSDLIRHFIETPHQPSVICLLIQKEVAERITAASPRTNQLAIFTQWYADVEIVEIISRAHFLPVPEVDSAIIRITPRAPQEQMHGLTELEKKQLFSFIKRGFSNPRKQLANNLSIKKIDEQHTKHFDFTRRAETLSIEEWITLFKALSEHL